MITKRTSAADFRTQLKDNSLFKETGINRDGRAYMTIAVDPHDDSAFTKLLRQHAFETNIHNVRIDLAGALELRKAFINNDDITFNDCVFADHLIANLEELEQGYMAPRALEGRKNTKASILALTKR